MEQDTQPNISFFKSWWFWLIVLVILVFCVWATSGILKDKKSANEGNQQQSQEKKSINEPTAFQWPSSTAKYITASPVDLSQIQGLSKYRSCAGHVRDGYNFNQELENDRSMKHYFYPILAYQGTLDKVKLFSPVDGEITYIDYEKDKVGGRPQNGGGLHISPTMDKNASVVLGHIYTVKDYMVGDMVNAGELVGYASLGEKGFDFDVDLSTQGGTGAYNGREVLGSIFDHMTPEVLSEFAKYGITPENTKFTKEYRDAHTCNYPEPGPEHSGRDNSDWVQLTH